jgi:hypothetical protein
MPEQEHTTRSAPAPRPARDREQGSGGPGHPLLELQQQAGNAAVVQMLAVQRHSLDPEEEAGS